MQLRKQTTLQTVYLSERIYDMAFTFIYHDGNDEKEKHEQLKEVHSLSSDTSYFR